MVTNEGTGANGIDNITERSDAAAAMTKPNVVFVITDDQGYGDLGCHGNPVVSTPNIDAFGEASIRLSQYHVGTTCAPTRSGLLTGLNCNSAGVWHTIGGASLLRDDVRTLPDVLAQQGGYSTGMFGKWHLGDDYPFRPMDRGFQHAVYHRGGGLTQISDYWGNNGFDDTYVVNGVDTKFRGYCTDIFVDQAMQFIRTHHEKQCERREDLSRNNDDGPFQPQPFLAYIATNAPHLPLNVEQKYRDLYADQDIPEDRRRYYGMITNIDDNFAKLTALLTELGLDDDTIVIFTTDNGTHSGCGLNKDQFVVSGYNAGMRGKKGSPYEGGHRVPFFIRYPRGSIAVSGGQDIGYLTSYTDIMPTLLDYCGIPKDGQPHMEGQSLRPLLRSVLQHNSDEEFAEWEVIPHARDQRLPLLSWQGRALVVDTQRIPHPLKWRLSSVMKGTYRLINGRELYNVATDPGQRTDISKVHPEVVSDLREEYENWWELCSRQRNHVSRTHIGSDKCPTVRLTTMSLCNEDGDTVWNQGQVRKAQSCVGWWPLYAEREAPYVIKVRRWPEEANYKIIDDIHGFDVPRGPDESFLHKASLDWYRNGMAVDVQGAHINVDGLQHYVDIDNKDVDASFCIHLSAGPHTLRAWLSGGTHVARATAMSPYYVSIALAS